MGGGGCSSFYNRGRETYDFTAGGRRLGSLSVSIKVMSAVLMHKDAVSSYLEASENGGNQCHMLTGQRAAAEGADWTRQLAWGQRVRQGPGSETVRLESSLPCSSLTS